MSAFRIARRTPTLWTNDHIQELIDERRRRNYDFWYNHPGRDRTQFWQEIANAVNSACRTNYTGRQCSNKFTSLVNDYNVSKSIKKMYI
jgi:hypothetical protein